MAKHRERRNGIVARWFRRIWWLRRVLILGAIAGAAFKAVKGRGGGGGAVGSGGFGGGPGGSGRPAPLGGPFASSMPAASTPPQSAEPESPAASAAPGGGVRTLVSVPPLPQSDGSDVAANDDEGDAPATGPSLAAVADAVDDGAASAADAERAWVEPLADGSCPESHPIKANDNSGIYHVPTGRFYKRTVAERCYASAEAAEADGYRRAKA